MKVIKFTSRESSLKVLLYFQRETIPAKADLHKFFAKGKQVLYCQSIPQLPHLENGGKHLPIRVITLGDVSING